MGGRAPDELYLTKEELLLINKAHDIAGAAKKVKDSSTAMRAQLQALSNILQDLDSVINKIQE